METTEWKGTALVTGASRGLGQAIALELAARGMHVIAGVRNLADGDCLLERARGLPGSLTVQRLDLSALGDYAPPGDLRVLVNNAGYRGPYLPIEETPMEEWRRTFETNFFGLVELTRRAIPSLRANGAGVICNIGSLGADMPMPFYSTYRISKVALSAFSEGLRVELAQFGTRVIEIPIGGVDTDMLKTSIAHRPPDAMAYPLYHDMATYPGSRPTQGATLAISPLEAARNVADQLFVPGPLRRPCDPNAVAGRAYVDSSTAEERAVALMAKFGTASL
jgi:NAD(P)-dependent dehydrogenase (short-subunit alcohol dehydrogenase family)